MVFPRVQKGMVLGALAALVAATPRRLAGQQQGQTAHDRLAGFGLLLRAPFFLSLGSRHG
jgi:hypothetical protein